MIIIGHPLVPFVPLAKITNIEDIKKTEPNCTVLIDFNDTKLVQYSISQEISIALHVEDLREACLANAIGAKFIVVDRVLSKRVQDIATEYLFDTKVLLLIEDESEIEEAAEDLIDGVIFKKEILDFS